MKFKNKPYIFYFSLILVLCTIMYFGNTVFLSTPVFNPTQNNIIESEPSHKKVYLTFDDGPSKVTSKILDILKENNIKATFFIVHAIDDNDTYLIKRAFDEGHSIGNHTYDHDFNKVYETEAMFWNSFTKDQDYIKSITGETPKIFRFPGGSHSTLVRNKHGKDFNKNIITKLNNMEIQYYDWQIDSNDGMSDNFSSSTIYNNVVKGFNSLKNKDNIIVLMHDSKGKSSTSEALTDIIKFFSDNGYTFDSL